MRKYVGRQTTGSVDVQRAVTWVGFPNNTRSGGLGFYLFYRVTPHLLTIVR